MQRIVLKFTTTLLFLTGCFARTAKIDTPCGIAWLSSLKIGGVEQWILIRGDERSIPLLLWLHGRPGASQIPLYHAYNRELEKNLW